MQAASVRSEAGSTSVLILGLAVVVFAISGLAVDGTRAFIFRRSLQTSADGAVLAASSEIDARRYYASGGRSTRLSSDAAEVAGRFLGPHAGDVDISLDITAERVTIELVGAVPTTFLGLVGIDELTVGATATARPIAGRLGP